MLALLKLIAPLHQKLRTQKCDLFFQALCPEPGDSLLDVGGGTGIAGEFARIYRYFSAVKVVNLEAQLIEDQSLAHVQCEIADGCSLPFRDQSFDWVFSNAVIEHVGGWQRQQSFAQEIRRVARKGYFVATPDRHFPIDPHTFLPFYQFLSPRWQRKICRFSPGYLRRYQPIDLLSAKDLSTLFPRATVEKLGLRVLPNNLVAYGRLQACSWKLCRR
jgi:ubiquinone/menaquinone biosynthesis C-methylase UbiE